MNQFDRKDGRPPRRKADVNAVLCILAGLAGGYPFAVEAGADLDESHRRMVALLQQVEAQSRRDNPYQSRSEAQRWRQRLQSMPESSPARARAEANYHLGVAELFLGNERRAIEHLTAADSLLAGMSGAPAEVVNELKFRLGVAFLRLGETRNCREHYTPESCILPIRDGGVHVLPEGSLAAVEQFAAVLTNTGPGTNRHLEALWLLNLASMTLGRYPHEVPAEYLIPPEAFAAEEAFPRFANVAPGLGIGTVSLSGGAVADDFDGDHYLDLLVSTSDAAGPVRFFRNERNGTFSERTEAAGLTGILGGLNMVPGRLRQRRRPRCPGAARGLVRDRWPAPQLPAAKPRGRHLCRRGLRRRPGRIPLSHPDRRLGGLRQRRRRRCLHRQ